MLRILLPMTLLLLFSCNTQKVVTDPKALSEDEAIISMSKGACFGSCPVYTIKIYDKGYCTFEGKNNVDRMGKYGKQLSKDIYKDILAQFEESGFHTLEDYYESNIPDLPSVSMAYQKDGVLKEIVGKRERPEILHKLQFSLERIAMIKEGWTLIEKPSSEEKQDPKQQEIKSEIIITTIGGPQLAKWFDNMRKEHGVRIIKKLSDGLDMWLISYNPKKNTPESIMEVLNNDEFIKSAVFNMKTEKR